MKTKSGWPPQGKAVASHAIQEREGGVVTVYDIISIPYLLIKWWIVFEISLNKL